MQEHRGPDSILFRNKVGFPVPLDDWFGGDFNQYARKILLSDVAKARDLFNVKNVQKWLKKDKLATNHRLAMKIWMLVNVELFSIKYPDN